MTTTEPTTLPAWLDLDAIHPPEARAALPALVDAARGVLESVANFNREHVQTMRSYYDRNDYTAGDVADLVDEHLGMKTADDYLLLAGALIEHTVIGQGNVTDRYAEELIRRYADLIDGVRCLGGGFLTLLPDVGHDAEEVRA